MTVNGNHADDIARLRKKAFILAGEYAWTGQDALELINILAKSQYAVVGVEYWRRVDDSPKWIATSDYERDCAPSEMWESYVACCFQGATDFIKRFTVEPEALFNVTWRSQEEEV